MMNLRSIHGDHDARAMGQYFCRDAGYPEPELERLGRDLNAGDISYEEAVGIRYDRLLSEVSEGQPIDHEALYRLTGDEVVAAAIRADFLESDPTRIEAFPVRFRPDMSPRMEQLLGIDRTKPPDSEMVCNLLANRDSEGAPIQGKTYAVARSNGARPQAFLSVTFSAGKTVSIAYAFAEPGMKAEIRRAHQAAVETTLRAMEERIGRIRLGSAGQGGREVGENAWITFFHTHSRLGDPQIHSHVAILNVVASRESYRVGSFHDKTLRGQFTYFRGVYQEALAENLRKSGLEATYDRDRLEARIDIPDRVVEAFSQRRNQILEAARKMAAGEERDFDALPRWEQIQIARVVRMATRPPKDAIEVGVGDWRDQLVPLNWNPDAIYQVAHRKIAERAMAALREPERRAFGLRMPDGGYHVGGAEKEWGLER